MATGRRSAAGSALRSPRPPAGSCDKCTRSAPSAPRARPHPEAARACGNLTQMKKSVPVAELKMGMYVAELDRPWTETPFVFQGFYLETDEQLETLKQKGDYTTSHAVDSAVYMTAFGRFLQLPAEDISLLGYLGLLQDVGKTRLPTELLNKRNRLSEAEFAQAKQHVQYSVEILSETPGLPPGLGELALLHHERQDGSGYPKGLKGRDIGLLGSIAGIIDTFDALTARRPYAEPVPPSAALSMLYKWRGSFFDPVLIEQFIRCIGIFPLGSTVELNSGEIGIVIAQNLEKRLQPRVMVIRDAAGNPLKPQKLLDLSRGLKAPDGEPYRIRRTLEYGRIPVTADSLFND